MTGLRYGATLSLLYFVILGIISYKNLKDHWKASGYQKELDEKKKNLSREEQRSNRNENIFIFGTWGTIGSTYLFWVYMGSDAAIIALCFSIAILVIYMCFLIICYMWRNSYAFIKENILDFFKF